MDTKVVEAVSTVPPVVEAPGFKVIVPPTPPPTVPVKLMAPTLDDTVKEPALELVEPLTKIFPPRPPPEIPVKPAVVSRVEFPLKVNGLPIVKLDAVNMVPFKFRPLGAEISKEPNTVKVFVERLLIVKEPLLLNVKL